MIMNILGKPANSFLEYKMWAAGSFKTMVTTNQMHGDAKW
jgi:hypothetical protein